jgi:hypothetical protein
MVDPDTHTLKCVKDASKLVENCKWMQIDREKVKHQTIYVPECLACTEQFVMYNDIKLVSLFKEKVSTSCTAPIRNDDGCFVHNTVRNIIGSKMMDTCVACDTRINFFAIQPVGKFTPGRAICAHSKSQEQKAE